jgi:hypothetical protein
MLLMLIVSSWSLEAQTTPQSAPPPTAQKTAIPASRVIASNLTLVEALGGASFARK